MSEELFSWVPAYETIATALLDYEDRRNELTSIANQAIGNGSDLNDMDPLTFFAMFNGKLQKFERRTEALKLVIDLLGLQIEAPKVFHGIPVLNPLRWRYWDGKPHTIENNWRFFRSLLAYADGPTDETQSAFVELFNTVRHQGNIGDASITMALYWARPSKYLPLDNNTCVYLRNRYDIAIKLPMDGEKYLALIKQVREKTDAPFTDISLCAWERGGWIPAPHDYDPGVTVEQWRELLINPEIATPSVLITLKCLNDVPKGATCTELSEFYGREKNYYNSNISTLGERVAKRLNLEIRDEPNGNYWPIVCLGNYVGKKRHGSFEWKLRDEVREALKSIDLDDVPLREGEGFEVPEFDANRFKRLIELYKIDFTKFRGPNAPDGGDHESYKWNDALAFHDNWDIDAEDFETRLTAALKPAATGQGALLGSGFEYSYANARKLASFNKEGVRDAFRKLFDPEAELPRAYSDFISDMDDLLQHYDGTEDKPLGDHHQNPKSVSLYLFFRYPDRYHYYKPSVADSLCACIGTKLPASPVGRYFIYEALCDDLMPLVEEDKGLVELSESVLSDEQRSADPAHHLLLQDIAYYSDAYMKNWHPDWEALLSGEKPITIGEKPMSPAPVYPKNLILYGPPGTGKTFQTKAYAVAICDGRKVEDVLDQMQTDEGYAEVSKRYKELVGNDRIGFTTFHQSYGYEEFIEGLRPKYVEEKATMTYPVEHGIFRKFCEKAESLVATAAASGDFPRYPENPNPRVWKMGLSTNGTPYLVDSCRKDGCIRLGWDETLPEDVEASNDLSSMNKKAILAFQEDMQPGDFVVVPGVSANEYGVAVVTGEFEWHPELGDAMRYRSAKWLKNIDRATFIEMNGGKRLTLQTVYELDRVTAAQLVEAMGLVSEPERKKQERKNYVFIIDEINRGNVSKVFGELITLLEESKRKGAKEELIVELPYSGESFGVPSNVYVIGTMNTADRSIALMDTALRRRFSFVEVMPDESLFESLEVEGVDIKNMLEVMNRRIELLYDREHTLGHAYLMDLRKTPTIECLRGIFQNKLIPLLQEYFFDDYAKIGAVLGAAAEDFIEKMPADNVFWSGSEVNYDVQPSYRMKGAPDNAESYKKIYEA